MSLFERIFRRQSLIGRTVPINIVTSCEAVIRRCSDVQAVIPTDYRYGRFYRYQNGTLIPPWRRYRY